MIPILVFLSVWLLLVGLLVAVDWATQPHKRLNWKDIDVQRQEQAARG